MDHPTPPVNADAQRQLALFAACIFDPGDVVEIRRFIIDPATGKYTARGSTWHTPAELPTLAAQLASENARGVNHHVGVNPRRASGGTTAADVALARTLFADFDNVTPEDARQRCEAAGLPPPTLIVASGHGAHCFWRVAEPIGDLAEWTRWQKKLIRALGSDPSVHDAPRLARAPGFTNHKPPAAPCYIIDGDPARRYALAPLADAILAAQPAAADLDDEHGDGAKPMALAAGDGKAAGLDVLKRATAYATKCPNVGEGERNPAAFALAAALVKDFDLTNDQAWPIFATWNAGNTPPLPEAELREVLASARKHGKHAAGSKANAPPLGGRAGAPTSKTAAKPTRKLRRVDAFQPFPCDALPEPIRSFVAAVARCTDTDPAFAALAVLVVAAGCIGNRVAALVRGGWIEPMVLWGAMIGRSGSIKTAVLKLVKRPLVELYKAARQRFAAAQEQYASAVAHYEITLAEWKKSQRVGPPTDPPLKPTPPVEECVYIVDTTIEAVAGILQQNPLGSTVAVDELAEWLGGFDRYSSKGGKGGDRAKWLSMYDAADVKVNRKGSPTIFVERAALSVLGGVQPRTMARLFGSAEREAGLLARLLVVCPPERAALWRDDGLTDDEAAAWRNLLAALMAIRPGEDENEYPRPRYIRIGRDALPLWIEWHNRHVPERLNIGDDDAEAHHSKLKGLCVRLALLFACIRAVTGGGSVTSIGADDMRRAILLTDWFKGESRRTYSLLAEDDDGRERRRLVELIQRKGGAVTVRDLLRSSRLFDDAEAAEAALCELVEAGWGAWETPPPGPDGGRPSTRFVLADPPAVDKTPDPESAAGFCQRQQGSEGDGDRDADGPAGLEKSETGPGMVEILL